MPTPETPGPTEVELAALRQQIAELRAEQQAMKQAIDEMVRTFRMLAVHLGIASEPYRKGSGRSKEGPAEIPGFG